MAHPGDTFLHVETNLGTRIAMTVHSEATVSQFKEIFCREHKENWPEFGDIRISAVKFEQEDKLYRIVDSMTWRVLFQGIRGERHINVEVENGDLVTIQADAPSVSTDTESNWQQSLGAPFQPTQPSEVSRPPDTAQNFAPEDSSPAVQNVQQPPSSSSGFPQEKFASSQSDLGVLVTSKATSPEMGSKEEALIGPDKTEAAYDLRVPDENRTSEHEAVKDDVTVDADDGKSVESTKKKKKSKKAKTTSEVASGAEVVEAVKVAEICDGKSDEETVCKDLASKVEDSAAERESVQNLETVKEQKRDGMEEVDQYASGRAEGVDKTEDKTKKRKRESDKEKESCEDHKTGDIDVKKDDGVGALSRCSCEAQGTKKLLVVDLNGILADVLGSRAESAPDGISNRPVFFRPFLASFLDFCFERFNVGIWSSRRVKLKYMTNLVMGNQAKDLVFGFGQDMCITTEFKTLENAAKPLFLKDLRRVWNHLGACSTCGKGKYDESNTLLVDDSPEKALCNPPHTGIFPYPYKYTDREDCALGPNGELRKYLERLADAENVQKFVAENPIGQSAITETHESWEFYSKVIEKYK